MKEAHNLRWGTIVDFRTVCRSILENWEIERIIPESIASKLKSININKIAIGELSGQDSIAAIIKASQQYNFEAILPVVVFTGTEFGSANFLKTSHDILRKRVKEVCNGIVLDTLLMYDFNFWWALNGRFIQAIISKYGSYSPCPGCHIYVHSMRIPLALKLNARYIISGARENHDGKTKINQAEVALNAYIELLKSWNIDLLLPLRNIKYRNHIAQIINDGSHKMKDQFKCLFKSNYCDANGEVFHNAAFVNNYYQGFGVPAAQKILNELFKNPDTNLEEVMKAFMKT